MREVIQRYRLNSEGNIAFLAVVLVGYFVGLIAGLNNGITPVQIGITAVLTLVYLFLGLADDAYFARYDSAGGKAAYFIIQLSLALTVQMILGPGSSWLIALPLVGTAVTELKGLWRWPIYLAVLGGIFFPLYFAVGLEQALFFTLSFSPAMLFVNVFTRLVVRAEEERAKAEDLAQQLEAANHQLSSYAAQVEELATTKERNRLAREIHDNLGHYLTVVNVQIKVAQAVMDANPAKAQDALEKAQGLTQEGLNAIRSSVAALRESPLGARSLPDAIGDLLAETQASGLVTTFDVRGEQRPLDEKTALTLFRTAQEGLTNVRKHASASRVDVVLDYDDPQQIMLCVCDNGVGVTTAVAAGMANDSLPAQGFGLLGIQERVQLLGGHMQFESAPGKGATLTVTVPGNAHD